MSLQSSIEALATRIADEFNAVRDENSAGGYPIYIQQTEPTVTGPAVWYQTDGSGNVIKKWVQTS